MFCRVCVCYIGKHFSAKKQNELMSKPGCALCAIMHGKDRMLLILRYTQISATVANF